MQKKFKVAVAGFHIESVSFLPIASTLADFEAVALRGDKIASELRGTNTAVGGFIEVLERESCEIVPFVYSFLGAVGPATDEAVEFYANEITQGISSAASELDGVLLFLHGAAWSPSYADPEAFIIDKVRRSIGTDKPIVVAFDYHGNIDGDTIRQANAAFSYRLSPHTDSAEAGRRAANCLIKTLRGEISPVCVVAKPNVVVPSIFSATALRPLADVLERAKSIEAASAEYTDITVMAGFSYGDAHNTGFSILVNTDADEARAKQIANELSALVWEHREGIYRPFPVYQPTEAIDRVLDQLNKGMRGKPFVLLEHADRMNDSTYLLDALLKRRDELKSVRIAVPFLWDNETANAALAAGKREEEGSTIRIRLGGKSSDKAGPQLEVDAKVLWAGHKTMRMSGRFMNGVEVDLGTTALLDIEGISVSVVSAFAFAVDSEPFAIFDQKPTDFDIIVLRSKTHFRSYYESVAQEILIVDTPDYGIADVTRLPYERLKTRGVYPFEDA